MQRFFVEPYQVLEEEHRITLTGPDLNHMKNVLRMRIGEDVWISDGSEKEYHCTIEEFQEDSAVLHILDAQESQYELPSRIYLFQGLPKGDKMELIIQKAVELGAVRVVPFFSRYCVGAPKKEEQKNLRYNRIAFEAAKQSGRGVVPQVELPVTYKQMLADAACNDAAFFCYEAGGEPLLSRLGGAETIGLITGSEGGFSPEEAAAAREAGCVQIGLGPRILRCETAPLAALAAVMTLTGNLQ